ncbi:linker for activation of T-cells family member 2 isoform X1 [Trachemys scripta elegans]|uniref:linker for activation of T-cells family member 2 isoform X1 n=1 Tax=Trachemys scripta elegans TaxID=31138 RepID=UPI001552109D|nr:linker for activation of T-cells family member 2 isoform X1 [Trachemys scripta elegans]XP_034608552.1 linker for activation of T-cells family member 2 isoform X1 [Trachemys scripta elegans]
MSQVELFWAAASLMLLGALVSMCMKCQRSATKQEKKLCKQRTLHENQPGFQVIRSYSIAVTRQDEIKLPDNIPVTRKTNKRLQATDIDGDNAEPRYQNFMREDNQELDAAYVNPIASDYFNCRTFLRPANEKEEDSCSYQNVVIGTSNSAESDDVDDYENSASIKIWKQSNISESPDDYPDYVNSDVAAVPN